MAFTYENTCRPQLTLSTTATLSDTQWPLPEELGHILHKSSVHGQAASSIKPEMAVDWKGLASPKSSHPTPKSRYREVFTALGQTIVELLCLRLNSLGCSKREQTALDSISNRIFQFQDLPSFGSSAPFRLPQNFGDLEAQQSIDIWIAHHPLSFILSKTLLLQSYRNGFCDRELLAIILAESDLFLDSEATSGVEAAFEEAHNDLLPRLENSVSLSTAQALVLLGWHDFCTDRPLQGYCFFELARKIVMRRLGSPAQEPPAGEQPIDGIDVRRIETELSQNIYWFTFSISLWFSLQLSSPDAATITPLAAVPLPASDPSHSAVYRLDSSFGNVVSLVAQKTGIGELWHLAHLASTIAPAFKLHSYRPDADSVPLHAIRSVVAAGLGGVPGRGADNTNPSLTFTRLAYRLLAIHVAFLRAGSDAGRRLAAAGGAEEVVRSIGGFAEATQTLQRQAALQNLFGDGDHDGKMVQWVTLGLDTCGRALSALKRGGWWREESEVLIALARRLLEISQLPKLRNTPGLVAIRETLRSIGR